MPTLRRLKNSQILMINSFLASNGSENKDSE